MNAKDKLLKHASEVGAIKTFQEVIDDFAWGSIRFNLTCDEFMSILLSDLLKMMVLESPCHTILLLVGELEIKDDRSYFDEVMVKHKHEILRVLQDLMEYNESKMMTRLKLAFANKILN